MYLVTAKQMQEIDRFTIESFGIPGRVLMENAGKSSTEIFINSFKDIEKKQVAIAAGRGNNGGDGFVMARYLFNKNIDVTVYLFSESDKVVKDAKSNLDLLYKLKIPVINICSKQDMADNNISMKHKDIWIDALFGTGLNSDIKGFFKNVINYINSLDKPVFSVDIPSGINSDSGRVCKTAIKACATATFGHAKIGHFIHPGCEFSGKLSIVDIGIPKFVTEKFKPQHTLITDKLIKNTLVPRKPEAHKGDCGHLLIVSGSSGKTGASILTAKGALKTGAGLVTIAAPESLNPILETTLVEAMTLCLNETDNHCIDETAFDTITHNLTNKKCLALGPGMGTENTTKKLVNKLIPFCNIPMVIDADGINCIADNPGILKTAKAPVILTPHPGEMAGLMQTDTQSIQKDRILYAIKFAEKYNVIIVLKGAKTIIATPCGKVYINPFGNSGMASGGMGDVLTGIIAGLITSGYSVESSAYTGVYLHAKAADTIYKTCTPIGYLASELIYSLSGQFKKYIKKQ